MYVSKHVCMFETVNHHPRAESDSSRKTFSIERFIQFFEICEGGYFWRPQTIMYVCLSEVSNHVCMFKTVNHVCMFKTSVNVCMYVSKHVCMFPIMYVCMYVCMYVSNIHTRLVS